MTSERTAEVLAGTVQVLDQVDTELAAVQSTAAQAWLDAEYERTDGWIRGIASPSSFAGELLSIREEHFDDPESPNYDAWEDTNDAYMWSAGDVPRSEPEPAEFSRARAFTLAWEPAYIDPAAAGSADYEVVYANGHHVRQTAGYGAQFLRWAGANVYEQASVIESWPEAAPPD